ncbi:hypothetical protein QVD17_23569 [Tagetes erecta]|uniref:Uncharacterized protein n=1 Tax=Tagetes erecta TaxID=13708 RepID=A0AAD8NU83_TARER|nr:hypothetical protein QVD17_23569 [Tagetes erecta]
MCRILGQSFVDNPLISLSSSLLSHSSFLFLVAEPNLTYPFYLHTNSSNCPLSSPRFNLFNFVSKTQS